MIVSHDNAARIVTTTTDSGDVVSTRPYTASENAAADRAIADAATLTDLEARIKRIEAHLWPPVAPDAPAPTDTSSVPTMAALGGAWPAGTLLRDGGKVWRNITGVPLSSAPSDLPGGTSHWKHLFVEVKATKTPPPATSAPAWSATAEYKPGDRVVRNGVVYEAIVAHGAAYAGTWGPPTTGVWKTV